MSNNIYSTNPWQTYGNITVNAAAVSGYPVNNSVLMSSPTYDTSHVKWASVNTTVAASLVQSGQLELNGENADLKINGVSLNETLAGIQDMLGIVKIDPALEEHFEELRIAGEHYRKLKEKFREQKQVWETLKNQDL